MTDSRHRRAPDVYTHPLWGLTCVLGEIALRLEHSRAAEETQTSPETQPHRRREGANRDVGR